MDSSTRVVRTPAVGEVRHRRPHRRGLRAFCGPARAGLPAREGERRKRREAPVSREATVRARQRVGQGCAGVACAGLKTKASDELQESAMAQPESGVTKKIKSDKLRQHSTKYTS